MWSNSQKTEDFVTFTEEILNRKFHFLCSDIYIYIYISKERQREYNTESTIISYQTAKSLSNFKNGLKVKQPSTLKMPLQKSFG